MCVCGLCMCVCVCVCVMCVCMRACMDASAIVSARHSHSKQAQDRSSILEYTLKN